MKCPKIWALAALAVHPDGSPLQAGLLRSRGRSEAHCEPCRVLTNLPGGPPALHRWSRSPRTASCLLEGHRCRLPVHPSLPKFCSPVDSRALESPQLLRVPENLDLKTC
uniref:Putative secreted protein n=1 Tax=Ixodes ricinus TaxID=34613 RepID=A0A6B0UEJ3_IXORI